MPSDARRGQEPLMFGRAVRARAVQLRSSMDALTNRPHLLVAEDDDAMRATLESELSRAGFRVTVAACGREAAELLELHELADGELHALVFDVRMPESGGIELLRWLREDGRKLPVVLISGCIDGLESLAESLGAVLLAKPFSRSALTEAIAASRRLRP